MAADNELRRREGKWPRVLLKDLASALKKSLNFSYDNEGRLDKNLPFDEFYFRRILSAHNFLLNRRILECAELCKE